MVRRIGGAGSAPPMEHYYLGAGRQASQVEIEQEHIMHEKT